MLFTEQIQFAPADVAQAAWAWVNAAAMPNGSAAGAAAYDHFVSTSVGEALQWIADSDEDPWPMEAGQTATEMSRGLGVDRVIVTGPSQMTARVADTGRRVRFQRRGEGTDEHVRVVGMVDELGREYTLRLPEQTVIRIRRGRQPR